jgi:hypothetical protein
MPREQRRDQKTAPYHASGLLQQPKQEEDVQSMNEQIVDVVVARVQPEQLTVHGMLEPRQRMPVSLFVCGQRPSNSLPTQAGSYMGIVDNVILVVVIDEVVTADCAIENECAHNQQQTQSDSSPRKTRLRLVWRNRFSGTLRLPPQCSCSGARTRF